MNKLKKEFDLKFRDGKDDNEWSSCHYGDMVDSPTPDDVWDFIVDGAIRDFAKQLKKQFKKHTIVWQKDPDTGIETTEEEAKTMCIALNGIAPDIIDMFIEDYLEGDTK